LAEFKGLLWAMKPGNDLERCRAAAIGGSVSIPVC
jgi:hypothetical protein